MGLKSYIARFSTALLALGLLAASGGFAWAAVDDYERRTYVPDDVTAGGVSLSGLDREQAREALEEAIESPLMKPVTVMYGDTSFELDPSSSLRLDIEGMLDQAFQPLCTTTVAERVLRRTLQEPLSVRVQPLLEVEGVALEEWVAEVAGGIDRPSKDATITRDAETDTIKVRKSRTGRRTDREQAVRVITEALLTGTKTVELPVETLEPEYAEEDLGKTIVVDLSERKLTLYHGLDVEKTFRVAVGAPGHSTPRGSWVIINKRYMPSWGNPGSAWAADMPRYIPPGVSNPLGTRALDLDAPAIRIHGTTADYSIGTAASHGCMRMHRWDIEDLYERVDVGTPVLIVW